MATVPVRRYTAEEYLALERQSETKYEFYRGERIPILAESDCHREIVHNIEYRTRSEFFRAKVLCAEVFAGSMRIKCPEGRYAYPDIVVVCGNPVLEGPCKDTLLNPIVIMEVLSPHTEAEDRGRKFQSCREINSLIEYVIISQDRMRIDHFVRLDNPAHWELRSWYLPEHVLSMANGQIQLKLPEVYANIELPSEPCSLHNR